MRSCRMYRGLSRFQELMSGLVATVTFVVILLQVLYRSQRRRRALREMRQNTAVMDVPGVCQGRKGSSEAGCCGDSRRDEQLRDIASKSLAEYVQWQRTTQSFVPYTGRPVPGLVDIGAPLSPKTRHGHPPAHDWIDFREYARFAASAIRAEMLRLRDLPRGDALLGTGRWPRHEPTSMTFRDTLSFLLSTILRDKEEERREARRASVRSAAAHELLPRTAPGPGHPSVLSLSGLDSCDGQLEGPAEVPIEEALSWLADTYERWRWGMRPGAELTTAPTARRFIAVTLHVLKHMQSLGKESERSNGGAQTAAPLLSRWSTGQR
eukprot:TRINITY_DN11262_c1_g1_i2.p2 TRINITY_DN11262_c1_g1~~TRINITY_DN11262_c1_g1_i2.p2  ORF type:complete len:323 (+),score=70.29 TRINITY_DN11262_c1_g1_i2:141-1109(+)